MANPSSVLSPTLSSSSSFVTVTSDSDDEVVYSVDGFSSNDGSHLASDDDFVLLDRPLSSRPAFQSEFSDSYEGRARTPSLSNLASDFQSLTLGEPGSYPESQSKPKKKKKKVVVVGDAKGKKKVSGSASSSSTAILLSPPKRLTRKEKKRKAAATQTTPTILDNPISFSSDPNATTETVYEEAVGYITSYVSLSHLHLDDDCSLAFLNISFIANPEAKGHSACRLTLLQALIIELGLATSSLPRSLTAARNFLKSRAFLNVREYLDVRGQGLKALQAIMYPSRKSLIKAIKVKKNRAPLALVKESGLQVLLVRAYHV